MTAKHTTEAVERCLDAFDGFVEYMRRAHDKSVDVFGQTSAELVATARAELSSLRARVEELERERGKAGGS